MGTNYYHYEKPPCACCGRPFEARHIGKSSAGWCFALHVYPSDGIHDLPQWRERWSVGEIRNEYDEPVTVEEMLRVITQRAFGAAPLRRDPTRMLWTDGAEREITDSWCRANHAIHGPNGLARHSIGYGCIGHGDGTWDRMTGDFS